jgi:hypothetical protein
VDKHFVMWKQFLLDSQHVPLIYSLLTSPNFSVTAPKITARSLPLGLFMTHVRTGKARPFARSIPSGAFDQYLLDIQKLPMISDPDEEKRLARRAVAGDETAAERLVRANLRFVCS